eukprot:1194696-Prorocentrum_minimum.AAC.9
MFEKWEKLGNWTQGEERGRVSGVLTLKAAVAEDPGARAGDADAEAAGGEGPEVQDQREGGGQAPGAALRHQLGAPPEGGQVPAHQGGATPLLRPRQALRGDGREPRETNQLNK